MVRTSKLGLWLVVVVVVGGVGLAYSGAVSGAAFPAQLPPPSAAAGLVVGTILVAVLLGAVLDRRAWATAGESVGLTAGGSQFDSEPDESGGSTFLGEPTLSGTAAGRPVRARTYSTNRGGEGSSKTYTVVEAQLREPVGWAGALGVGVGGGTDVEIDVMSGRTVDGVGIRGDVPEEVAAALVTPQVKDSLTGLDDVVTVGDFQSSVVDGMTDALEDADSMGATAIKGMLDLADDGDDGSSRTVAVQDRGLLLDRERLTQRINAVATVADAVDRASR